MRLWRIIKLFIYVAFITVAIFRLTTDIMTPVFAWLGYANKSPEYAMVIGYLAGVATFLHFDRDID